MHIDWCPSDDHDRIEQLLAALAYLGATAEPFDIGMGLNTFTVDADTLTVYRDAWRVDLEGPEHLVRAIIGEQTR